MHKREASDAHRPKDSVTTLLPTYFISHGGGPWTHMKQHTGNMYDALEASLQDIPRQLGGTKPKAVLVVSGHWEEDEFTVMSGARPPMIYDYHGFPAHTYEIRYDAPGSPGIAARVRELLQEAGLPVRLNAQRGYDHGTFVPLYAMYPNAEGRASALIKRGYDPDHNSPGPRPRTAAERRRTDCRERPELSQSAADGACGARCVQSVR